MRDEIVEQVVDKFYERSQKGITEYGCTVADNNHDDFLEELQSELMDAVIYLQKLKTQNNQKG